MNDPLLPIMCRVEAREENSHDVFTLVLEPPPHYGSFEPGQFNMLYLPGAGEAAISISGPPAEAGRVVHTIRAVGNVTRLLQKLQPGDKLGVRGPFGASWPMDAAAGKDLLLVAGGIGLAPLRPVLYQVAADRLAYGRVTLLYGARSPADILFAEQVLDWKHQGLIDLFVTVDSGTDDWAGDVGVVTQFIARAAFSPPQALAMVCGPEIMIRFAVNKLTELGLTGSQVHVSLERNMKCAVGFCGHCQLGPHFICKDGPVFTYDSVESFLLTKGF